MKNPSFNLLIVLSTAFFSLTALTAEKNIDEASFFDVGGLNEAFTAEHAEHDDSCYPKGENRPEMMGFAATGISKSQFESVLARVDKVYQPEFRKMGWQLDMVNFWENDQVNAAAAPHPQNPNRRGVLMFGGMARHPKMTVDAFTMIACHEVGHHIGGAPKTTKREWSASNEGQSDYFASLKCARKVFALDNNVAIMSRKSVPAEARSKCFSKFSGNEDRAICLRTMLAGQELAQVLGALTEEGINKAIANVVNQCRARFPRQAAQCIKANLTQTMGMPQNIVTAILSDVEKGRLRQLQLPTPSLSKTDPNVVKKTDHSHPQAQCRLDTLYQGAICPVDKDVAVSQSHVEKGACVRRTGDVEGVRPLCWFAPGDRENNRRNNIFQLPIFVGQR